jgi:hypothetical protein
MFNTVSPSFNLIPVPIQQQAERPRYGSRHILRRENGYNLNIETMST